MLHKGPVRNGQREVTFTLPLEVPSNSVNLCGDFNEWSQGSLPMTSDANGHYAVTVTLKVGRRYRYRYLIDESRWENDWLADDYVPNEFGGEDSAVDV